MSFTDSERGDLREVAVGQISPREYGRLEAKVDALEAEMQAMRGDVRALLDMANRSRGALWVGMGLAGLFGGLLTSVGRSWLGR